MRILLLSQWYAPEPVARPHLLAEALVERGHEVASICAFPSYPQGRIYPGYRQRLWDVERTGGVKVIRLPIYPDHSRSRVLRTLNYASFAASTALLGPVLSGPADVAWVHNPPPSLGLAAAWLTALRGIPMIYEVQDMWPETAAASGMLNNRLVLSGIDRLTSAIYDRSAAITVISPGLKRELVRKGVSPNKVHLIPNWADDRIYRPMEPDPQLAEEHGLSGKFVVLFAGNMGAAQALSSVLAAADLLRDLADIRIVFVGEGVDAPRLRREAADRALPNVVFIGQQPHERMPYFFAMADVLLAHLRRDPCFEMTIPSKIPAYMAAGRPVLVGAGGDPADLVRDSGAGLACEPGDPLALAAAIRQLHGMAPEARRAMGETGRRFFLTWFTRDSLITRYEEVFARGAMTASATGQRHASGEVDASRKQVSVREGTVARGPCACDSPPRTAEGVIS
ncbi:glycosyltransferase family 4 protein [Sorangium sp. So ce124]|uniref:glycosyltransferase family 4 protein n=1 Tax=Sorangium sp. So ce124 TaxID=3133280 RepID=UPI003F63CB13